MVIPIGLPCGGNCVQCGCIACDATSRSLEVTFTGLAPFHTPPTCADCGTAFNGIPFNLSYESKPNVDTCKFRYPLTGRMPHCVTREFWIEASTQYFPGANTTTVIVQLFLFEGFNNVFFRKTTFPGRLDCDNFINETIPRISSVGSGCSYGGATCKATIL